MSGLSRKQQRTRARREYERFTRIWREDRRLSGMYGKKGPARPSFSQWYAVYERDQRRRPEPAPVQQEYLQKEDPWVEQLDPRVTEPAPVEHERGVTTIQIVGDEEA